MKKFAFTIVFLTLFILFLLIFFVPREEDLVKTYPDCYADNLDEYDANWCKENMFNKVGADLALPVVDKCPVCEECQTLTFNEMINEKLIELDPIGETNQRIYKINDKEDYQIILDTGEIYDKSQLKLDLVPVELEVNIVR